MANLSTIGLGGQTHRCRVVRGGAFNNTDNNMRCANRNYNHPNNRNNNLGFRVVVSTFLFADTTVIPVMPGGSRTSFRPRSKMAESVPGRASGPSVGVAVRPGIYQPLCALGWPLAQSTFL